MVCALVRRLTLCVSLLIVFAAPALAAKRVALVIGNSGYLHTPALTNPKNDAADFAAVLRGLGFDVVEGQDLAKAEMDRKIAEFAGKLSGTQAAVFFYAGHGLQVGQQNYLVPIDAQLTSAASLDFEMVRLDLIQRTMERETTTNLMFLDACRDNPLARNLARAMGTRSLAIGRGLAATESGVGTLISFSTQPGNIALDGEGRNSPFAEALIKRVKAGAGHDISAILIDVRNDVIKATESRQVPWEHSAMRAKFYFERAATQNATKVKAAAARDAGSGVAGSREQLYQSLMRRILAAKLRGAINATDEGKDNYYRTGVRAPKAMAACIDWEKSTPIRLEHRGFSFAHSDSQGDADERALSQCYRIANGCPCIIVDRNDTNAIVFPPAWAEQHKSALQKK
jgi:uncharacterized caspase-like protein